MGYHERVAVAAGELEPYVSLANSTCSFLLEVSRDRVALETSVESCSCLLRPSHVAETKAFVFTNLTFGRVFFRSWNVNLST